MVSTQQTSVRKTPLHDLHVSMNARMAPFAGYDMPIQYSGIIREHTAARRDAAVFDTCHMGELEITGTTALADIDRLLTADIASLPIGRCRYSLMCNEAGAVIDDLLVYRRGENHVMLVINAARRHDDLRWIRSRCSARTHVTDISEQTAKIDIQGPRAPALAQALTGQSISDMTFYSFIYSTYCNKELLISRTGYTGEVGFELYCDSDSARGLWTDCIEAGATPAGLGARNTLRLEMGMPLYGHELDETRNAAQAGLKQAISSEKSFVGADWIRRDDPARQRLVGIRFTERQTARGKAHVLDADGQPVGMVTSGSFAPSLGHAVAMAYVNPWFATPGIPVQVDAGKRPLQGTIAALPFYSGGTARKRLSRFLRPESGGAPNRAAATQC